ncbi:MAG: glycosyltransferase family 4 protein [Nitrospirales bacterium]
MGKVQRVFDQQKSVITVVRIIARLNVGGPAKQAFFLTHGLNGENFQSYLITGVVGMGEESLDVPYALQGDQMYVVPMLGREISWWQDIQAFFKLCKILKILQPDIVHTHTAKAGTLGRLAAILTAVPIKIHTFHGHIFKGYFGKAKTTFFVIIERILAYFTDRIIVLSESQCRDLTHEFKIATRPKFQVIPLGFNLSPFISAGRNTAGARQMFGIASKAFALGFVGRLVSIKNPLLLLEAYCQIQDYYQATQNSLREKSESWYVIVAGGGELLESMRAEARTRGCSEHILFCGWQQKVQDIYAAVNVVVLTSLNEGTPVALIEAMASGKPFIATNVGGVIDLVVGEGVQTRGHNGGVFTLFENGLLVQSQDATGLAAAMLYISTHPVEAMKMGRAGREFAAKFFNENRLLGDIRALYQDLFVEKGVQRNLSSSG